MMKDPEMAVLPPDASGPLTIKTTYELAHEAERNAQMKSTETIVEGAGFGIAPDGAGGLEGNGG